MVVVIREPIAPKSCPVFLTIRFGQLHENSLGYIYASCSVSPKPLALYTSCGVKIIGNMYRPVAA